MHGGGTSFPQEDGLKKAGSESVGQGVLRSGYPECGSGGDTGQALWGVQTWSNTMRGKADASACG